MKNDQPVMSKQHWQKTQEQTHNSQARQGEDREKTQNKNKVCVCVCMYERLVENGRVWCRRMTMSFTRSTIILTAFKIVILLLLLLR